MHKIAIIQARMGATRFPGKVLELLHDKSVLQWVIDACSQISGIDQVVVATSTSKADDLIVEFCQNYSTDYFRGSESDVLGRFYQTAKTFNADIVVRITADCPLLNPQVASQVLWFVSHGHADYASNIMPPSWPDGLDCEAFTMASLETAHKNAVRPSDREHVTPYILNNQYKFKIHNVTSPIPGLENHRWTLDTKEDLAFLNELVKASKKNASTYDYLQTLKENLHIQQAPYKRNEGFENSLKAENNSCVDFKNSQGLLKKALKTIPLGSQTFSKSYIQYPLNTSPFFATHGNGAKVWDVDGNEYIDLVSGLLPVVLGYNDPDVNTAIQTQLNKGISFSLATELEIQLAEKLFSIIPSAEKVRFAKTGTDVTSAAVRLARAYTGRDKMIMCGYHGWQDWSIGTTTRNKGVPKAVSDLTTLVPYNHLEKIEDLLKTEEYAGIIMEPCNMVEPKPGYLQGIKDACERFGSVFIFDEVVTGFRMHLGGAQSYFGVTPHLSCFGKAMGNGMPISAIVGQNHVMEEMEEIFFSGTFGGETLSIAASLATIEKIEKEKVVDYLWSYGESLGSSIKSLIRGNLLEDVIKLTGYDPWQIFQFVDHPHATNFEIKTFFIQEMIRRGILINASLNINFAHRNLEKHKIINAFEEVLGLIKESLHNKTLQKNLQSPSLQPLFRVR